LDYSFSRRPNARLNTSWTLTATSLGRKGFCRTWCASVCAARTAELPKPLMYMIGRSGRLSRASLAVSTPFRSGMTKSTIIRSTRSSFRSSRSSAFRPLDASTTSCPAYRSISTAAVRASASSSTTRITALRRPHVRDRRAALVDPLRRRALRRLGGGRD
jgi:hypothetical protein